MNAALSPPSDRRLAALAFTALVHALMLLGWQMTRRVPMPLQAEPARIQWLDLRALAPVPARPAQAPERTHAPVGAPAREQAEPHTIPQAIHVVPQLPALPMPVPAVAAPLPAPSAASASADPGAASADAAAAASGTAAQGAPAAGSAQALPGGPLLQGALLQGGLRAAGSVDKALRKENNAYIVAPPDSPQMRMRRGMEAAHAMVPPKLWEAPKIEELVNNTGDGTRHTRVITGNGTYCINERSTHVSIDTIETLGKVTPHLTCPQHETPAGSQEWKTARD